MSQSGFRREHWTNDSRVWGWTLPLSREKKHCLSHDFYFFLGTTTREAGHKRISLFSSHDFDWTRSPFLSINCWKWTKAINWCLFTVLFYPKRGIWQNRFWSHSPFGKAIAKTDGLKKPSPLESELESDSKECTHPRRSTFDVNPRFEISLRTLHITYYLPPDRDERKPTKCPHFKDLGFSCCCRCHQNGYCIYLYNTRMNRTEKASVHSVFFVACRHLNSCSMGSQCREDRLSISHPAPLHAVP